MNIRAVTRIPQLLLRLLPAPRLMRPVFHWLSAFLTAFVFCVPSSLVYGQSYPNKPIRIVVPFAAGGSTDAMARIVAQKLGENLGQQVVVENKAGAGGVIGFELVSKSPTDGYTLVFGPTSTLTAISSIHRIPFDPVRDFQPVSLVATVPNVLVVNPSLPTQSVKELIAFAKARPGKLAFASSGPGSASHLSGLQFNQLAGTDLVHIPYKGGAPATAALLGGEASVAFGDPAVVWPQVKAGRLRALAVTSAKRSSAMPDLPTIAEAGVPGYEMTTRYGVLAPAGTPKEIVSRLNTEIMKVLATPDVRDRLLQQGADPAGSSPEQFAAHIKGEMTQWAKVAGADDRQSASAPPPPPVLAPKPESPPPAATAPQPKAVPAPPKVAAKPAPKAAPAPMASSKSARAKMADKAAPKRPPEEIWWNAWFENPKGLAARVLNLREHHTFFLDLSRLLYDQGLGTGASDVLAQAVKEASPDRPLRLLVRPVILSDNLEFAATQPQTFHELTVEPKKLSSNTDDKALLSDYRAGKITKRKLSDASRLGSLVSFDVIPNDVGCASLALSVWRDDLLTPLDHLVINVPVRTGTSGTGDCVTPNNGGVLRGGLDTLLDLNWSSANLQSKAADASLHIFEADVRGMVRSVAVFLDADIYRKYKSTKAGDAGIYSWRLDSILSQYLRGDLRRRIEDARNTMANSGKHAYYNISHELKTKLFSAKHKSDQPAASRALAALQKTASQKDKAVVIARMFDAKNDLVLLPLGLLAADGPTRIMERPIAIVQALRSTKRRQEDSCVMPWTFAIPPALDGLSGDEAAMISGIDPAKSPKWIDWKRDHKQLLAYFSSTPAQRDKRQAEGLLILAHHDAGNLWYTKDPDDRVVKENVRREFPGGSIAIIAACSVGGVDKENRLLLERLNDHGVDALVVSPFSIRAEFGARFAIAFQQAIFEAATRNERLTVLGLFNSAVLKLPKIQGASHLDEMVLEFQISGDHSIKMCEMK